MHPAKYENDIDGIATDIEGPVYSNQTILEDLFMTKYLLEKIAAQIPHIILLLGAPSTLKIINQEKYRQGVDEIIGVLTDRYPDIRRKYEAWCSSKLLTTARPESDPPAFMVMTMDLLHYATVDDRVSISAETRQVVDWRSPDPRAEGK